MRRDPARDVLGAIEAAPGRGTRVPWPDEPRSLSLVSSCSKGAGMGSCDQGGGNPIGLDVGIHVIAKPFNVTDFGAKV